MNHRTECRRLGIPLSWIALMILDAGLVVMAIGQDSRPDVLSQDADRPATVTQIDGAGDQGREDVRFEAIDVFVDSGAVPLAAFQFEMQSRRPGVEIVGIEGGEHAAFAEPPYYDPRAMNNNRVILAAFSTADELPSGRSRVARVHVQFQGPEPHKFETRLDVSATTDGKPIPATISLTKATL